MSQKVDAKKLEKAEAKLQQKQAMRADQVTSRPAAPPVKLESATASQVTSKKEAKMEAKGTNRAQDVRIDNFDIAYGDKLVFLPHIYYNNGSTKFISAPC